MVKKYLLSLMLFALITPWAAFGQNHTLTVYDGEVTKKSVPMYVYYFDDFSRSQYVIPATQIDAMTTGTISAIKYYTSFTQEYTTLSEVDIYLAEVSSTSISDFIDKSNATIVYSGTVDFVLVDEKCEATITFTTPYTYNGGNLLIGCDNTTDAGYKNISFYGQSVSGASVAGYNSNSLSGVTAHQQDFIPKTTFTFTGGNSNYCETPSNLQISNVTHESATVSWTSAVGNYNLEYKRSTDDEYTRVGVSTNSYTFTGLTSLTNYDVRVQAVCDPGVTESLWMEGSFTTTTVAEEVGNAWSDDFEGNACGWELINGTCTNAWVWGTAANHDGSYGLYISNDEGTTNAYTVNSSTMVYATKLLNFTEGKFEFSYNWMANGESTYDYLRVALAPSSVALTAGTNVLSGFGTSILPADWIALDGGSKLNQVSEWQSQNLAINVTAGNYYLVLAWRNDSSQGNQPPAAVDNVSITKIACEYEVTDLAVSGITTTSASLSWDGGEAAQWQVAYGTSNNFEGATVEIVDEATYDMIGLEDNTTFYVRIRAYCGGNDFGAWTSTQFKTACAASTEYPFTENFDSYTGVTSGSINNLPDCWNYINGTTYSYYAGYPVVYNASNYSNSGNNHLRLYSYANYNEDNTTTYDPKDQYAILPPMENLNGKQLTLFARRANTNSTFKVGMMTDPTDTSTFVEIATTAPTGNYEEYTYQLTGTGNYLAIMIEAATSTATSRTVYIDDITIDFPPTCPKPTSLTYADVTGHGATLSWTENGEAEAWQVCLNDDEENLIDVTENPYTLTELAEETDFTVKVRANCGGNNGVSEWSNVVSFTTPQACPVPTSLFISDITGYHATLDWNGSTDSYNVMYRTKATADGLLEDFSTALNWEKYTGLLEYVLSDSIDLTTTTSGWVYGTGNGVFDRHAKINIWSTNIKNWLVTPSVEVAENYMFSFDLALTKFSGSLQPVVDTLQQDDKFVVLITTDDGSNWTILRQWDNTESEYVFNNIACSATGEHVSFDLSEYLGQNVRIAFYAESTESGGDNNLHIDNVLIGIPIPAGEWQIYASDTTSYTITGLNPETDYEVRVESSCPDEISHATSIVSFTTDMACLAPTGLAATQIMPNSIELTWTDRNEATAWQIQVNEEDPMDVTAIPYLVENLESDSTYTFMVRSNCGVEGYSEWSNAINVTTLVACPVPTDVEVSDITHNGATMTWTGYNESYTVMIAEGNTVLNADFETGDLSQGDFTTTADYAWTVVLDTITETLYAMSYSGGHSQTSALELEVTLTEESTLTFSAKISSESGWDKGYFSIDSVYHINGISGNGDWIHYSYPLPAGTHTLGWYYIKDSSVSNFKDCFYVDDIVIISFPAGDEYNTTAQTYTFEDLTASTPYQVKVKGVCDNTETEWSETFAFTTLPALPSQTIALEAGINWVSFNIETTLDDIKAALVEALPGTEILIQHQTQNTFYNPLTQRWIGEMTFDPTQMYMIQIVADAEITLLGTPINPAELIIRNGYTWFAYPLSKSMTLSDVFAGFAVDGDWVYSKTNNSKYLRSRWQGQLTELNPGQGYIYQNGQGERVFVFPEVTGKDAPTPVKSSRFDSHWPDFYYPNYKLQQPFVAIIEIDGVIIDATYPSWDALEVAAFVDYDECRANNFYLTNDYVLEWGDPYPILNGNPIYYTDPGEEIHFKLYDHANGIEYDHCAIIYQDEPIAPRTGDCYYEGWRDPYDAIVLSFSREVETFTKDIIGYGESEKDHYYLIASPIGIVDPVDVENMTSDEFDLYAFDQAEELEWMNYKTNNFDLEPGKGYLYANMDDVTLTFTGTPYTDECEVFLAKTDAPFSGWNLVGNPYAVEAYITKPFYVLNENGNGIMPEALFRAIEPMEGVFVLADDDGESLTFITESPDKSPSLALNLSHNQSVIDRAIVRFDEGPKLPKFQLHESDTKVYIPVDGKDYAIVNAGRDDACTVSTEIPVNFKAEKNGSYSLNFSSEAVNFDYLHLIDNLTGNDIDLLANPSYSFDAKTTDHPFRFKLVYATGDNNTNDDFAYISNGQLIITGVETSHGTTLQIFDVLGHLVLSKELSTPHSSLLTPHLPTGVYMLQLTNGESVKTQKIVIE